MKNFKKTKICTLTLTSLFVSSIADAQSYNFNFYNGSTGTSAPQMAAPQAVAAPPQAPISAVPLMAPATMDSEKLLRSGVAFTLGYGVHQSNEIGTKILRGGLSFISSYDFHFDVEYLHGIPDDNLKSLQGISIGVRNNYALAQAVSVTLGANLFGFGVKEVYDDQKINVGGALNAGLAFHLNKTVDLNLVYEYGLKDELNGEQSVATTSGIRAGMNFRF